MIKNAHKYLTEGLHTDDKAKTPIEAGEYRQGPVCTGNHTYPDHKCVPESMKKIIDQYNDKFKVEHDPYELAAWLLYEVLSLHPFIDGNGRISRLFWCFSLVADRLPFLLTPFPGRRKAYKLYIQCIEKDQQSFASEHKKLTTLTVVSVTETWRNFISNLKHEFLEGHREIIAWLDEQGLNCMPAEEKLIDK